MAVATAASSVRATAQHSGGPIATAPPPPDRSLLRMGAVAGVSGVLLQIGMAFGHPSHADPNDSVAAFREYAASDLWTAVHIGQFVGTVLIALGLFAFARTMTGRAGRVGALAMVGAVMAPIVIAVFAVQMAVDGVALRATIATWLGAATPASQEAAFQVADGVRAVEKGLAGFFQLVNGMALVALGLAAAGSRDHGRWIGWVGAAAGIGALAGGTATAHTGFSSTASMILLVPTVCTLVFMVGITVSMWRRAGRLSGEQEAAS